MATEESKHVLALLEDVKTIQTGSASEVNFYLSRTRSMGVANTLTPNQPKSSYNLSSPKSLKSKKILNRLPTNLIDG